MGGKSKKQTIGFHYYFSILFGLSRGPFNELVEIKVGDKTAWGGHLCDIDPRAIESPELFGGEKKEGGIQGPFRLFFGNPDQVLPGAEAVEVGAGTPYGGTQVLPSVKDTIGGLVSEFRGVTTLWFDGLISSMNPYPKEWKFRMRRYSHGWDGDPWYQIKSAIFLAGGEIHAMNPAHIIYECLSNRSWGRGMPTSLINENSFIYAANLFCDEAFGLCFLWQRKENIDEFIQIVLRHVGAVLYTDPETGEETLKAIRDDYVAADLPHFQRGAGLVDITEDDSASSDNAYNEVIGTGHDPITNEDFQLRVHNLAARHSQGAANADDKKYPGIPTRELLARVLQRDLREHASGLKKLTVVLDRAGWRIRPGMPFKISDPKRGIASMIVRAGEITDRSYSDGRITIKVVQDVFGMPSASFVTPVESSWVPPATEAEPALAERLIEAGYRDLVVRMSPADLAAVTPEDSMIGTVAVAPNPTTYQYDLASRVQGEPAYVADTSGAFTGTATLAAAITPLQTTFTVTGAAYFGVDNIDEAVMIDDEIVQLIDFDPVTSICTVARGTADTIPAAHSMGARLWTIDDDFVPDGRLYVEGEIVEAKVLSRTSSDVLTEGEAATLEATLVGRQDRPYPPGNFEIDGQSAFAMTGQHPEPVLTWTHRDRVLQADQLVPHEDGSIGPEAGTTYNVRVIDPSDDSVIRSTTAIAGVTWTYDSTMIAADTPPHVVLIELESERDGKTSWQKYSVLVTIDGGYGIGYGLNYGGAP